MKSLWWFVKGCGVAVAMSVVLFIVLTGMSICGLVYLGRGSQSKSETR